MKGYERYPSQSQALVAGEQVGHGLLVHEELLLAAPEARSTGGPPA